MIEHESTKTFIHTSVLLEEVIEYMNLRPEGSYLDATVGGGGHSLRMVQALGGGHLYALDQDAHALEAAKQRLASYASKTTFLRGNFEHAKEILAGLGVDALDGILLDLGVSSPMFDTPERGFSYRFDGPLDMRMDQDQALCAHTIVNTYTQERLAKIIAMYGEEKFARNIAKHIVLARNEKLIESTFQLNDIIKAAIPAKMRRDTHPSKRTFQAIRIECNRELEVLEKALQELTSILKPAGRLLIITFHSLEDRMVKNAFRTMENPCICPPSFPVCVCHRVSRGSVITRKAIVPSEQEQIDNPRSKSAKLRVFEKRLA
ncbi:MAG: 16S rRNA (cytosine(1402)-N(4))-methyltransferase RsmH [Lachnospiraceae bacterium]|jgi:16S rRNA (cytosine1402-N4)-methyltransferase|nr:16S rRNA (cytosine(1402)-N(4))-methyltransferase RsmH [Lachnospiraceae bacterium]